MKLKSVLRFLGIVLIGLAAWYFFIKGYNYKVTFTVSQSQSIVYDHLAKWNDGKYPSDTVVTVLEKEPFSKVKQNFKFGDSVFLYDWELKMVDPKTTRVIALVTDPENSFSQNFKILFSDNHLKKKSISSVNKFGKSLVKNAENYRLSSISDSIISAQNCAYITLKSKTSNKAVIMQRNIYYVMNYINSQEEVKLDGNPFLEVKEWDIENDSITFEFCFPINKLVKYPETPDNVSIKKTEERKALKIDFNGNYKISDRAWYQLRDYAKYNNISVTNLPTEIFLNDPHDGTNSLEWVAKVFMPLQ